MTILNILNAVLSPDQVGLVVILSVLCALLIAANIILAVYLHKRGERKLCTYQLQNRRDKLLEQLDILRSGGVLSPEDIEQEDDDEEEILVEDDEEDENDDEKNDVAPKQQVISNLSVVTQEEVDETMDAQILVVAKTSKEAREKLGVADKEYDKKRYYVRYSLGFEAKLRSSSVEVKERYVALLNELSLYKGVKTVTSYRQQRIYKGRKTLGKIVFSGKTLCLALALNPADYAETKYRGIDKSDKKRYANTPLFLKLTSARRLEYAKYLLVQLADANTIMLEESPVAPVVDFSEKTYEELFLDNKLQIIVLGEVPDSVEQVEDEDEEEFDEIVDATVIEELTRYNRSYSARVIQADDELKARYSELKNHILEYQGVYNKITWKREAFFADKRTCVATFAIRGKTLCLYLPVDASKFDGTKYKVEDLASKGSNAKLPTMYRIRSDRSTKFAKEMLDIVLTEHGLKVNEDYKFVNFRPVYKSTENLIKKGFIRAKTTVVETPTTEVVKKVVKKAAATTAKAPARKPTKKPTDVAEQSAANS